MDTDVLIVGGGLAGLSLASELHAAGRDVTLIEAADRLGGRILTRQINGAAFDLGPAWFWPGQPRIAALIDRLGLQAFDQFAQGALVYQDRTGHVQRDRGFSSMAGSLRIAGGMGTLTQGLSQQIPQSRLHLGTRLIALTKTPSGITAHTATASGPGSITAAQVVLALPPRIVADTLTLSPELPPAARAALRAIPTWMAGHAKIIAVYDRPHWREAGLSGDGMSQRGPMVELHDASPSQGGPYALFGFLGVPPHLRQQHAQDIRDLARAQLVDLFGPPLAQPLALELQDWAFDPHIATPDDHVPLGTHPDYGLPDGLGHLWDGTLILSSTETAPRFGGYLEGALEAAETTLGHLTGGVKSRN